MPNTLLGGIPNEQHRKAKEQRLRRTLNRNGYSLHRSQDQHIHPDNLGGYMIVNSHVNGVVAGSRFVLDLDDVDEFVGEWCE